MNKAVLTGRLQIIVPSSRFDRAPQRADDPTSPPPQNYRTGRAPLHRQQIVRQFARLRAIEPGGLMALSGSVRFETSRRVRPVGCVRSGRPNRRSCGRRCRRRTSGTSPLYFPLSKSLIRFSSVQAFPCGRGFLCQISLAPQLLEIGLGGGQRGGKGGRSKRGDETVTTRTGQNVRPP